MGNIVPIPLSAKVSGIGVDFHPCCGDESSFSLRVESVKMKWGAWKSIYLLVTRYPSPSNSIDGG